MNDPKTCPRCSRPIPASSPEDLCPRCLLEAALRPVATPGAAAGPPSPSEIGALVPDYEVLELIGQGGLGAVYRARHRKLGQEAALKVLPPASDPAFEERFRREAAALSRLRHENIVRFFGHGRAGDGFWIAMQYVRGASLRALLARRAVDRRRGVEILVGVCRALEHAHHSGLVHRDMKPENILVDEEGRTLVADFGIARIQTPAIGDVTLTPTRFAVGTPHYMAPEQLERPDSVDHRADVYAVAVIAYEVFTRRLPLGVFPPPSATPGVDPRADAILLPALDREPANRPSITELGRRLGELKNPAPPAAPTPPITPSPAAAPHPARSAPPPATPPPAVGRNTKAPLSLILTGAILVFFLSFAAWAEGEVELFRPTLPPEGLGLKMGRLSRETLPDALESIPPYRAGQVWRTFTVSADAWDSNLFGIPNWIPVLVGLLLGGLAAAMIALRWVRSWPFLLGGAGYGLLHCLLFFLLMLGKEVTDDVAHQTLSPGFGVVFSLLAFGGMVTAAVMVARQVQEPRSRRKPRTRPKARERRRSRTRSG